MTSFSRGILNVVCGVTSLVASAVAVDYWNCSQEILRQVRLPDPSELDFRASVGTGGVKVEEGTLPSANLEGNVFTLLGEYKVLVTGRNQSVVVEHDDVSLSVTKTLSGFTPLLKVQTKWSVRVGETIDQPVLTYTNQIMIGDLTLGVPLFASQAYVQESELATRSSALDMIQFVDGVVERIADDRVHLTEQDPYYVIAKDIYDYSFASLKAQSDGTLIEPVRSAETFKGDLLDGAKNGDHKKTKSLTKTEDGSYVYLQELGIKDEYNGRLAVSVMLDADGTISVLHGFLDENGRPRSNSVHVLRPDGELMAVVASSEGEEIETREIKPFLSKELVEAYGKATRRNAEKIIQLIEKPEGRSYKLNVKNSRKTQMLNFVG